MTRWNRIYNYLRSNPEPIYTDDLHSNLLKYEPELSLQYFRVSVSQMIKKGYVKVHARDEGLKGRSLLVLGDTEPESVKVPPPHEYDIRTWINTVRWI